VLLEIRNQHCSEVLQIFQELLNIATARKQHMGEAANFCVLSPIEVNLLFFELLRINKC